MKKYILHSQASIHPKVRYDSFQQDRITDTRIGLFCQLSSQQHFSQSEMLNFGQSSAIQIINQIVRIPIRFPILLLLNKSGLIQINILASMAIQKVIFKLLLKRKIQLLGTKIAHKTNTIWLMALSFLNKCFKDTIVQEVLNITFTKIN